MENKYKDGNCVKLSAKVDDINLIQLSKDFLKDVELNFKKFNEKYKSFVKANKKYLNNKKYIFVPEDLVKKSPLTIINAPWGSGKTFFIESFTKSFIDNQIESNVFDSIIIIDAWKFSSSNSVPIEFASEISKNIVELHNVSKKIKEGVTNKLFKSITPSQVSASLNLNLGLLSLGLEANKNITKQKKDNEQEINLAFKKFTENNIKTIIFIDNLERLGSYSWDLLKCIIKLQEFPNFLIVLPLNLDKMKNNKKEFADQMEYPIQKYIDFNYYNFSQDYYHFLINGFKGKQSEKIIQRINQILDNDIEGQKLSIREVKTSFEKHDIFNIENEYNIYKKIKDFIWNPVNVLDSIIINDINTFKNYHKKKAAVLTNFHNEEINKKPWINSLLNPNTSNIGKYETKIFDNINSGQMYYYNLNSDYILDLNNISEKIENYKNLLRTLVKQLKEEKELKNKTLTKHEQTLLIEQKNKENIQKDYNDYESKKGSAEFEWSSEEFALKEKILSNQVDRVTELEKEKKKIEGNFLDICRNIEENENKLNQLNQICIKLYIDELKKIDELKEITDYKHEYILNFLNKNFENIFGWIEDYKNFDELILEKINKNFYDLFV